MASRRVLQKESKAIALVVRIGGYIIKHGWQECSVPPIDHPLAKWFLYPVWQIGDITVQPRAETQNSIKACNIIRQGLGLRKWSSKYPNDEMDIRPGNCGWRDDRPVCFDSCP